MMYTFSEEKDLLAMLQLLIDEIDSFQHFVLDD